MSGSTRATRMCRVLAAALALASPAGDATAQDADKRPPRPVGRLERILEPDLATLAPQERPEAARVALERRLRPLAGQRNDEALWRRAREIADDYLSTQWRRGAFVGAKPELAFFVRCDRGSMSQAEIAAGRLVCLVGVATLRQAEFASFRIGVDGAPAGVVMLPPERRPAAIEAEIERRLRAFAGATNDEALWARVREEIGAYLTGLMREGALVGRTPPEAFYVRCDRTVMRPADVSDGRLVCRVGVAVRQPGEFEHMRVETKL